MTDMAAGTTNEITIYSTSWCRWCDRAKELFAAQGVAYTDVDIEKWDDPRDRLEHLTGARSVPQIFVGQTHVGGFDELAALEREGALAALFEAEGVPVRV